MADTDQILEAIKQWIMQFLGGAQQKKQEPREVAGGTVTPAKSKTTKPVYTPAAPPAAPSKPSRDQYALNMIDPREIRYLQQLEKIMGGMNLTRRASEDIMAGKPTFGSGGVMEGLSGNERPEDYS